MKLNFNTIKLKSTHMFCLLSPEFTDDEDDDDEKDDDEKDEREAEESPAGDATTDEVDSPKKIPKSMYFNVTLKGGKSNSGDFSDIHSDTD